MQKLVHILRFEIRTAFSRPSFLFVSFGIPLISLLVFFGVRIIQGSPSSGNGVDNQSSIPDKLAVEGYVDRAGLIKKLPPDLPADVLLSYAGEAQASQALEDGAIQAYYVIPEDYLQSGDLLYFKPDYNPIFEDRQDWVMRRTLMFNLAGDDIQRTERAWNPVNSLRRTELAAQTQASSGLAEGCETPGYSCESSALLRYLPLILMIVFFISILMAASMLLQSVGIEKENRVMEVIIVSTSPYQILGGKIVGLGILGLLQTITWLCTIYFLFNTGGQAFNLPQGFTIPASFLAWGLAFFLAGYALYASLMAGAGALMPDTKSYSTTAMIVASPIYFGYMTTLFLGFQPHGWLATLLSVFPFTSPVVMMWRMAQGNLPGWQPWIALLLLAITAYIILRLVARMFRASELISGQPFSLPRYLKTLWGSA